MGETELKFLDKQIKESQDISRKDKLLLREIQARLKRHNLRIKALYEWKKGVAFRNSLERK